MFLFKLVCACKKILSINILFSPKKLGSESCSDQQSFSNNFVWINTICVRNFFAVRWGAVDITKSLSSDVNCVCLLSLWAKIWKSWKWGKLKFCDISVKKVRSKIRTLSAKWEAREEHCCQHLDNLSPYLPHKVSRPN